MMTELQPAETLSLQAIAGKIKLTIEQIARLSGVSRRQITYWTQRGLIPSAEDRAIEAIEKALRIRAELQRGRSLRWAARAIDGLEASRQERAQALREMPLAELRETFAARLAELAMLAEQSREAAGLVDDAAALGPLAMRLGRLRLADWLEGLPRSASLGEQAIRLEEALDRMNCLLAELRRLAGSPGDEAEPASFWLDEAELLGRLSLNATEAAQVCGVTVRQLTYWTDRGLVAAEGEGRAYGLAALRKTLLIRQALDAGHSLEKAVAVVESQLAAESQAESELAARPTMAFRSDLTSQLVGLIRAAESLGDRLVLHFALSRLRGAAAAFDGSSAGLHCRLRERPSELAERISRIEEAADCLERALSGEAIS